MRFHDSVSRSAHLYDRGVVITERWTPAMKEAQKGGQR